MDFFDVISSRRSIRQFENKPIEKNKVDQILEAALRSPTSRGGRPWEFVIVSDPGLLDKISKSRPGGAGFLKDAPLAIAVCADPQKSGPWVEDATIAALTIQLAARALDMGSCWSQIRMRNYNDQKSSAQYVAEILGLPENLKVECIIGLGYPAESKSPYDKKELLFDRVSYNHFGAKEYT